MNSSSPDDLALNVSHDQADMVYFIHEGAVKIAGYTSGGEEIIKAVLHPGEVFGELAVYGEDTRSDFAQAVEKTELCILHRDAVADMMLHISGFRLFLHKLIGQRTLITQKRLEALLFKDARTRIGEYVLGQSKQYGRKTLDGAYVLRNYLTHQEIANFTGTSHQTVTTVLNEFREKCYLDFDWKRITVRMVEKMKGAMDEYPSISSSASREIEPIPHPNIQQDSISVCGMYVSLKF